MQELKRIEVDVFFLYVGVINLGVSFDFEIG